MKLIKSIILLALCLQVACKPVFQAGKIEESGDVIIMETELGSDATPYSSREEELEKEKIKTAVLEDAVIVFHRSGGIAGVDEKWIIHIEGQIDGPDGKQRQVEPSEAQSLFGLIQTSGFFDFNDSYIPLDTCCDRINYSVTVHFEGRNKTVKTIDESPTQPDQLMKIITLISELSFESE